MMTASPKIQAAVDLAISRGVGRHDVAPPLHRILWTLGFQVRPPHYASAARNAALMGGFWGAWMAVFGAFMAWHRRPEHAAQVVPVAIALACAGGLLFGATMAFMIRNRARKARLPHWDALPG